MIKPETVRIWALEFNEATEQPHFEKNSFRIRKKIFCTLDEKKMQAVLKLNENDQSVFCAYDEKAAYPVKGAWGKQGWTIFELNLCHPDLFRDALTTAFCTVAPKKLATLYLPPTED